MKTVSAAVRCVVSGEGHWVEKIREDYGLLCKPQEEGGSPDLNILHQVYKIFKPIPAQLIRDCGIKTLFLSDTMGPNRPYYPNHGFYIRNSVTLNTDIFYHPDVQDDFFDHRGYFIDRPTQTLYHEFAHGYDAAHDELSLKPEWMALSGWSKEPKKGLKRLVIKGDKDTPDVIGEYYFSPKAGFTRFYAKRNPYDDFADSFSFYIGNLKDKLPENKQEYLKKLLGKYYS